MKKEHRFLRLSGATGVVRVASYQNRDHVVVPVVALMEGVVRASNSKQWELVTAKVLEAFPYAWNGRPIIPRHPSEAQGLLANDPEFLQQNQFGTIFYAKTNEKKLLMEAWLDPARAKEIGLAAESVINRARAGEPIEVSIGAAIMVAEQSGEFNGKHYDGVWMDISPDHLAMLEEGVRGACNNEMGCGAPRLAEEFPMPEPKDKDKTLRERLLALITFRNGKAEADVSDSELRSMLSAALRADEPGYLGIDSVFPGDNIVVYAVAPEDSIVLFRRGYSLNTDGAKLKDKKEEVKPVTRFEPVAASEAPCGCQRTPEEEAAMKTKADRVKALIENPKMKLATTHQAALEAAPDAAIDAMEAMAKTLEAPPEPTAEEKLTKEKADKAVADAAAAAATAEATRVAAAATETARVAALATTGVPVAKPATLEEYIAAAPPEVRDIIQESVRVAKAHKTATITALKATGRCDYTDAELEGKSSVELEKLVKLCGAVPTTDGRVLDFSGRGMATPPVPGSTGKVAAPPSFHKEVRVATGVDKAS